MEKPVYKAAQVDFKATMEALAPGEYVVISVSSNDISSPRSIVCRIAKEMEGSYEVHKTINGYRIDRTQ